MMKNITLLGTLCALALFGSAYTQIAEPQNQLASKAQEEESEKIVTRDHVVNGIFSAVNLKAAADVFINVGGPQEITLKGAPEDLDDLKLTVEKGSLIIDSKTSLKGKVFQGGTINIGDGHIIGTGNIVCINNVCTADSIILPSPIEIYITVPKLAAVALTGSGSIDVDQVTGDTFNVNLVGSGDVAIKSAHVSRFTVNLSGSGDVTAEGSVNKLNVQLAGSGDVKVEKLAATDAVVDISGSGTVRTFATNSLNAQVTGSGDIRYKGSPKVTRRVLGSGSIRQIK